MLFLKCKTLVLGSRLLFFCSCKRVDLKIVARTQAVADGGVLFSCPRGSQTPRWHPCGTPLPSQQPRVFP